MRCSLRSALLLACLCAPGATRLAAATEMWVVENQTDQVYRINVNTLSAVNVGSTGINMRFGGIAFDPSGSTLYAWNSRPATGGDLYQINQQTGAFSLIGGDSSVIMDTFDINPLTGEAIGWSIDAKLQNLDLATGDATPRVSVSDPLLSGVCSAFDSSGNLYTMRNGQLFVADIDTGQTTLVGATGLSATLTFTSLGYNFSDNMLYAIPVISPALTIPLYRFNPTTGAATFVGNISGIPTTTMTRQFTAATFAPVPEPGTLSLALAALVCSALAIRRDLLSRT